MIHVSAPGYVFISGEWSILEPGNAGLVAAVNKRSHVEVQEFFSEEPTRIEVSIVAEELGIRERKGTFDGKSIVFTPELSEDELQKLRFVRSAAEVALRYLKEAGVSTKSFALKTWTQEMHVGVDGQRKKIGLGVSSSITVAAIAAILELHGLHAEKSKDLIYKLGVIAHYGSQGKVGSSFDVAASTYGGTFSYIAPDMVKLTEQLQQKSVKQVAEARWPLLHIQPMEVPESLYLAVGWTKASADTSVMIKAMNVWKESNPTEYGSQIEVLSETVDRLLGAWRMKDKEAIRDLLKQNAIRLRELTQASGVPIETEDLRKLCELAEQNGAVGKLSGAGGGDCGIAVCFDEHAADDIKAAWKAAGLFALDVALDKEGVKVVKKTLEAHGGAAPGAPPSATAEGLVHK
jgi:phosphomevalonate kinase